MNVTESASCSIAPESRRSDGTGRLSAGLRACDSLRQQQDRHPQFAGEQRQGARDLGEARRAVVASDRDQLQVIDHHQTQWPAAVRPTDLRDDVLDPRVAGRDMSSGAARSFRIAALTFAQSASSRFAATDAVGVDVAHRRQHAPAHRLRTASPG